jgi:hypothetical protein
MLCDKAGKPLPPSQCRMLRAWVGAWFIPNRHLSLRKPTAVELASDAASVAACKADAMARLAEEKSVEVDGKTVHLVDSACWDLVGQREVVVEGGLQQVRASHPSVSLACRRMRACVRACVESASKRKMHSWQGVDQVT